MNENDRSAELLRDLAKLLIKYPADTWRAILTRLREGRFVSELEAALDAALVRIPERERLTSGKRSGARDPLLALRDVNLLLAEVLSDFRAKLKRRELMPNLAELREFAHVCGIKDQIPLKREQAIAFLIRYLSEKQPRDVAHLLGSMRGTRRDFEAEFERWANLIMQRSKPE